MVGSNCKELFSLNLLWLFILYNYLWIKIILVYWYFLIFCCFFRFKYIVNSASIVITLHCPAICIFCYFVHCYSSWSLFRYVISSVFAIHIFFCKIGTLIFEINAIHREKLWKYTGSNLFHKLIWTISIYKSSFSGCMSMKIQICKKSILLMKVNNHFPDWVNWWLLLCRWI